MRDLSRERLPRWHPERLGRLRLDFDRERPAARPVAETMEDGGEVADQDATAPAQMAALNPPMTAGRWLAAQVGHPFGRSPAGRKERHGTRDAGAAAYPRRGVSGANADGGWPMKGKARA
ncbi:MAG: hypothetical protein ACKV19_01735 [Verrucomicrobiales bacterium]